MSNGNLKKREKKKKKTALKLNGFMRDSLKEVEEKVTYTHTEGNM